MYYQNYNDIIATSGHRKGILGFLGNPLTAHTYIDIGFEKTRYLNKQ